MSTTEHRPLRITPLPMPRQPVEPAFTEALPVVEPPAPRARAGRPHRTRGSELAALAFALPLPIPAQRGPSEV
ncbi:hypothetical protein [Pseudonocardia endophytica]|uniref:Uncharacterized protein n=1 Tax=Pseudonocardia endophytica TaxID=401976 RepID=A0A4R1HDU3_PSEEN|nr:hypothetical protein [Pseudonocardia endophytica]TCK20214.1 hypothetical protein EV378_4164 [Pseudonocardia endophytica]